MIKLGTFDAGNLSAFTDKKGTQTMETDGRGNYFLNGKQVSEEFIVHRLMDGYSTLTAAGEQMKAPYAAAENANLRGE
jgi:hypothetical protein